MVVRLLLRAQSILMPSECLFRIVQLVSKNLRNFCENWYGAVEGYFTALSKEECLFALLPEIRNAGDVDIRIEDYLHAG